MTNGLKVLTCVGMRRAPGKHEASPSFIPLRPHKPPAQNTQSPPDITSKKSWTIYILLLIKSVKPCLINLTFSRHAANFLVFFNHWWNVKHQFDAQGWVFSRLHSASMMLMPSQGSDLVTSQRCSRSDILDLCNLSSSS